MTTATAAAPILQSVKVGIEYFLPSDYFYWIPNGFIDANVSVESAELAEDFWGTLSAAAEDWADANLGAGVFSQIIMEP